MTREVAIKAIQDFIGWFKEDSLIRKALEMAIKALENHDTFMKYAYSQGKQDALSQEPCTDAVSRAELLKAIDTWDKFGYTETGCFVREPKGDYVPYIHYDDVIKCIKGMPPVTQKPIECDDAVSRDAVLSKKIYTETEEGWSGYTVDADYIEHLPSVTQKPKTGHWKRISMDRYTTHAQYWYECNKCGEHNLGNTDYCPNCGADMRDKVVEE